MTRLRASLTDLDPPVTRTRQAVPTHELDAVLAVGQLAALTRDARLAGCQSATAGLLAELFGAVAASHAVTVTLTDPSATGGARSPLTPVATVGPLQLPLAAEHAAVYGYGLLAGVVSAGVSETAVAAAARSSYAVHRSRRDMLVEMIRARHQSPVVSAPAYDIPFQVTDPDTARRLARYLEARCAAVYVRSIASMQRGDRRFVSAALVDCAVRGVGWGGQPTAFPGLTRA